MLKLHIWIGVFAWSVDLTIIDSLKWKNMLSLFVSSLIWIVLISNICDLTIIILGFQMSIKAPFSDPQTTEF